EHLRRAQRASHELLGSGKPLDHVHLLAVQLVDDGLVSHPAWTHARADRIDARLTRMDRHLRARPGFTGNRLDLDHPVIDLGDLELEKAAHQAPMGTRDSDLWAAPVSASARYLDDVDA